MKRGIRIGSAKTGAMKAFMPDLSTDPQIALAEGVCADAKGNIYAAAAQVREEVRPERGYRRMSLALMYMASGYY